MLKSPDIAVAVFVKTPGLSPIKTRLAERIGTTRAEEFYRRSLRCIVEVLRNAATLCNMVPLWAVAETAGLRDPLWSQFDVIDQGKGSLGDRLDCVYQSLAAKHAGVIFLGADFPHLRVETLVDACHFLTESSSRFLIGTTNDGGFSLFAGKGTLSTSVWTGVNYSQSSTARELVIALEHHGPVEQFAMGADVDTFEDLTRIMPSLESTDVLPAQQQLAKWLREQWN